MFKSLILRQMYPTTEENGFASRDFHLTANKTGVVSKGCFISQANKDTKTEALQI